MSVTGQSAPDPFEILVAGSISGCAGVLVCHPFDVIRTRIQISKQNKGALACLRDVIKESGVKGLYKGILGPLFAQAIYKATIFTTNALVSKHIFTGPKSNQSVFLSGAIAGSLNAAIVSPVELLRTRHILSATKASYSTIFRSLLIERGFLGLFKGLIPTIFRDGPGVGVYFLTFDLCKSNLLEAYLSKSPRQSETVLPSNSTLLTIKLLSASCAGIAFWTVALPIDTIKTIYESANIGGDMVCQSRWLLRTIKEGGGISMLFRAWPVAMGRGIPSAAITLTTFDIVSEWLAIQRSKKLS
jgi:solute carrier family 25 (mitochondrial carnitine/acylcarnitine transporter), member 20/29